MTVARKPYHKRPPPRGLVNLKAPNIVGFEALLRGQQPFVNGGFESFATSPVEFINQMLRQKTAGPDAPWLAGE